jgi:hypothetical protein
LVRSSASSSVSTTTSTASCAGASRIQLPPIKHHAKLPALTLRPRPVSCFEIVPTSAS